MTDAISPFEEYLAEERTIYRLMGQGEWQKAYDACRKQATFELIQTTTPNRDRKRWQFWKPRYIVITEYRRVG